MLLFFMDPDLNSVYFEDINTEIYGFSYHTREIKKPLLEDMQVSVNNHIQILMAHGGDAAHLPINFNSLELSPIFLHCPGTYPQTTGDL